MTNLIIKQNNNLSKLNEDTIKLITSSLSENTKKMYQIAFNLFTRFLDALEEDNKNKQLDLIICEFIAYLAPSKSLSTIRSYVFAIKCILNFQGYELREKEIRLTLKGLAKKKTSNQKQAPALTSEVYNRIIDFNFASMLKLIEKRNFIILSLLRFCLLRVSELVSLKVSDITPSEDNNYCLRIEKSKTSNEEAFVYLPNDLAISIKEYVKVANLEANDLLISSMSKSSKLLGNALNVSNVNHMLKRLAKNAGYSDLNLSSHSGRVGMCQDLVKANYNTSQIALAGRWKSPSMVIRYSRKLGLAKSAVANYLNSSH